MSEITPDGAQPGVPRLVPDMDLPPYTFVPGQTPHPFSDPRGHSYGRGTGPCEALDVERWSACRPYLYAIDLFNHGYYWEAHEAWEGLWNACARTGPTADFLKGLIQLAVAGVKLREGRTQGVLDHARRALELFEKTRRAISPTLRFMGLGIADLDVLARGIADRASTPVVPAPTQGPLFEPVLPSA
jgi:hypothetical protein